MYSKIIWATDGSAAADAALPQVCGLVYSNTTSGAGGTAVVVLHCSETFVGPRAYGLEVNVDEPELQEKIKAQAAELESEGLNVTTEFVTGQSGIAAHAIAEAAKSDGADLIVVGTRGHTRLGGLLLGSVTQRLLQLAPCPVLSVPAR
jgi:nucleotide-binding universal stress UspA family protein